MATRLVTDWLKFKGVMNTHETLTNQRMPPIVQPIALATISNDALIPLNAANQQAPLVLVLVAGVTIRRSSKG
jgi:hypothetical protein